MEKTNAFFTKIVGSTFCNGQELISKLKHNDVLNLVREKDNKFDPNAIAVLNMDFKKLGFIPKDTAVGLAKEMDNNKIVDAHVSEVTGGGTKNIGCNILIEIYKKDNMTSHVECDATPVDLY